MELRHFPGQGPAWVNIYQLLVFIVLIPEGKRKLLYARTEYQIRTFACIKEQEICGELPFSSETFSLLAKWNESLWVAESSLKGSIMWYQSSQFLKWRLSQEQ